MRDARNRISAGKAAGREWAHHKREVRWATIDTTIEVGCPNPFGIHHSLPCAGATRFTLLGKFTLFALLGFSLGF